jgi:isoleucyl-tRNA synthetase
MKANFPKLEKKILKFWNDNNIFQKSLKKGKKNFVFYEGPPTANGKPGIHHVLTRAFKDLICRYKTMQGFKVLRKAGWDTHGLPVELQVEKELGLKSKRDIDKYGIARFNKKCRESVWKYKKEWENLTKRTGFWLDLENPYITYNTDYIESVWSILKDIYEKGLLYQGFKVVHYCPRCGTPLSSHEVAQGYKKIKEPAVFVKLRIKNLEFKNSYLLIWTTTPWTLPGNVAVAINPKFTYAKVKVDGEYLILAKKRIEECQIQGEIVQEFKGKDLLDLRYEELYSISSEASKNAYKVIAGDFVSLEEGTGLVHIAPAFGEDDMEAVKGQNKKHKSQKIPDIPVLLTVNEEGKFTLDVKKWAGMFFKEADPLIIEDLKQNNLLFKEEMYEHDYPFCWRCKTPLLYYAKKSWFIGMKKLKDDLIKNNEKINWIPSYLKEGRFGEWLREVKDWSLSRERYWGTPLPVWQCKECQNTKVIGGKKDLLKQKYTTNKYFILRHGENVYTTEIKDIAYPKSAQFSLGLTDEGKKKIKDLSPKIKRAKIDLIFSSDYKRAKETAEIVASELGINIKLDKRLRDVNLGVYHGRPKQEMYNDFPDANARFYKKPKGGESWLGCRKRMISFINEINKKYQDKNVLIVSHGDPLWLLEDIMKGLSKEQSAKKIIKKGIIKTGEFRKINFSQLPLNEKGELDLHRPYIDSITFPCDKCQGLMNRVPEVIDCWFDSGAMPFAQYHYPFENKNLILQKKQFPADFICEAIDQTRGWFYTLLAISTLLEKGAPYKNIVSLGHILDEKGEKMSKSRGNVVDPWYIAEKYGMDIVRWYFYTASQPGDPKLFSEKDVENKLKRFLMTFWHCYEFYNTYSKRFAARERIASANQQFNLHGSASNILDKWIVSKLNKLILEVTDLLNNYDITASARQIENFIINDLSLWHIRRSRKRFQKPETEKELEEAENTLGFVLLTISKLASPFIPFLSDYIYQKIRFSIIDPQQSNSVHLEEWPKADKELINESLNKKMKAVREVVALALAERAKAGIKVRQPLQRLGIRGSFNSKGITRSEATGSQFGDDKELLDLIKEEVNVREIVFDSKIKGQVELDTKITSELEEEGNLREIVRNIQQMRKEMAFTAKDIILIQFKGGSKASEFLLKKQDKILAETKAKELNEVKEKNFKSKKELVINGEKLQLSIKKS